MADSGTPAAGAAERPQERAPRGAGEGKPAFRPPRLAFVEPRLEEQGDLIDVTRGFFGTFSP